MFQMLNTCHVFTPMSGRGTFVNPLRTRRDLGCGSARTAFRVWVSIDLDLYRDGQGLGLHLVDGGISSSFCLVFTL